MLTVSAAHQIDTSCSDDDDDLSSDPTVIGLSVGLALSGFFCILLAIDKFCYGKGEGLNNSLLGGPADEDRFRSWK